MLRTSDDLEGYLRRLERRYETLEDGTTLVSMGAQQPPMALRLAPPVLVAEMAIGRVPADATVALRLFRRLLELNAAQLMHTAYGLAGDKIVLSSALELENLDSNELEALLSDVDMALAEQVPSLLELVRAPA